MSCATVPGANCAAADANTPSQLAFAGGAAPAEDAPTSARARALAPVAARSVSFRIRLPSVGVKRRYHGVWDLKWVQTCPVAIRPAKANRHAPHLSTELKEALALPLIEVPERGYMGRPLPPNRPTTAA